MLCWSTHLFGRGQNKVVSVGEATPLHGVGWGVSLTWGGNMYTPEHTVNSGGIKNNWFLCYWVLDKNLVRYIAEIFFHMQCLKKLGSCRLMKLLCFLFVVVFGFFGNTKAFFSSVAILEFCHSILICRQQQSLQNVIYIQLNQKFTYTAQKDTQCFSFVIVWSEIRLNLSC